MTDNLDIFMILVLAALVIFVITVSVLALSDAQAQAKRALDDALAEKLEGTERPAPEPDEARR